MQKFLWSGYRLGKSGVMLAIYGIFAAYIVYLVVTAPLLSTKLIFGGVGLFVLTVALYFEYLKILYANMIAKLTVDCDIPKAEELQNKLIKRDFAKGFQKSLILFDSLLLMDQGKYTGCSLHLQEHHEFFHGSLDYLFIYYHTQLHLAYFFNDQELAERTYSKLQSLKNQPKKKMKPLFSWDEIEGVNYFISQRYSKSIQAFEKVNTNLFNPRELVYYRYMKAQTLLALKRQQEASQLLQEMNTEKNTIKIGR
ncbi:tetratricopeptide (TPR) repeat protein [Enterococcus sp. PF1-24]|uniref:hypothetical protein n=1 Tax=unclassified Enterococcus TaxID=2608891 RepID=UPI002474B21A|nr:MULTISPECIES: hypothetical protein [unclassified Enterococcus]MDH6363940.1 tetratricopeptide (TPR) repeat protein [Enterococcus sp. PFB1-1]MDH6401041.1 tetratricopeptide (TPR) repeat protein [Enterococcus sp. PF1-24]